MSDPTDTQPADVPVEGRTLDNGEPAMPAAASPAGAGADAPGPVSTDPAASGKAKGSNLQDLVDEPAKVMRIGTMIRQLLAEVKSAPLDDAARERLAEIHERSIKELEDGLAPELVEELERISLPFPENATPSDAELRIAQAQLVGWLEGLFHGIQTAIAAQHAAREQAAAQLHLRQLPPGTMIAPGVVIGENGEPQRAAAGQRSGPVPSGQPEDPDHGPGQYL
ncbi:bacterial proteasome activator family protein [Pseudarthrobacter sp. AL07]|uniref:bacterial proteasome activator family protein n=1 Tax=unclassified Pseudarthrobacter TaxID=2647000 RepID=UPI00249B3B29|nr:MULTISPECIES: bacterial proteasome activator family protein [unclassified Pseudarthrobacter]MDI3194243.1 bacterial proteasome activator family protein [Pseudarthrobacter sp. AL20]MDI3208309.1 bacterial proteasome activator family protein [Pseudarthrobacter sp. AL07]